MSNVLARGIALAVFVLVIVATATAQGQSTRDTDTSALVAELRALRADLNRAAGANMRMQLLLARLTLQEQRITSLGRQMAEVQGQLAPATSNRTATQARLSEIEESRAKGTLPPEIDEKLAYDAKQLSRILSEQSMREQHLRTQESELLTALTSEQSRWTDFNARLDELERSLQVR